MRKIAEKRAGSWKITTCERIAVEGWWFNYAEVAFTTIVLTENEFNCLNATARQNIASKSKVQVLRGSLEQTASRLWKTGGLEDVACRTLAPEMVIRWLDSAFVQHPTYLTWCCGYEDAKYRTKLEWIGAQHKLLADVGDEPRILDTTDFGLTDLSSRLGWSSLFGVGRGKSPRQSGAGSQTSGQSDEPPLAPPEDGDESSEEETILLRGSGTDGDGRSVDPAVSEEAEERARSQECGLIPDIMGEAEGWLATLRTHYVGKDGNYKGRYYSKLMQWIPPTWTKQVGTVKVFVVVGQDFSKDQPKTRFPDVGIITAPCIDLPNVYTNHLRNVEDAIENRLTLKAKPCTWTGADKSKVGAFIRKALGPKGIFSEKRVLDWFERHWNLADMRSGKWGENRFISTFENLLAEVSPEFRFKTAIKAEHMPELKAPRFLVADGDVGQVLALATVRCMEELLFETMESHSIKHVGKMEAMKRLLEHMVPPKRAQEKGCTFVEGDGSAWDTTCNDRVRKHIENPVMEKISRHLAATYIQPASWAEAHNTANAKEKLKLYFKKFHEQASIEIQAIRRSGHRGTSVLNWWINFVMWSCCLFKEPERLLDPATRWVTDVAGVSRWFYGVYEGDDSGVSTCPKLCQVTPEDVKEYEAGTLTLRELGDKYCVPDASVTASIQALAFWDRAGFNMKFVFAKKRGTIVGCHIGLTATDITSKTGSVVPNGVFCPELPRALKGAVSCSPSMLEAVRDCVPQKIVTTMAASALARASDFAGRIPTLSRKYLQFANELDITDFEDREMSMRCIGEDGLSAANVRISIEAANGAMSNADEQAIMEALDYTATDDELQAFSLYPWDMETLDHFDAFARSVPAKWRAGGSV